jgi:hypothetical protein
VTVPPNNVKLLKAITGAVGVVAIVDGSAATRASSRVPFTSEMYVNSNREKSIRPNNNSRKTGTTIANSMRLCARSPRRYVTGPP